MESEKPLHRDDAIKAKLQEVAIGLPTRPPWFDALGRLSPSSTDEDRLVVYQAIRDSGVFPDEVGFNLVAAQIDDLVSNLRQPPLVEFEKQMEAIAEAHGVEDGLWEKGKEPPEYREVFQRYIETWDQLYLRELLARGEQEIAELFRDDRHEYERRLEIGRRFLVGAVTENDETLFRWAHTLMEEISGCMEAISPMGPLGCRYRNDDGFVELMVYPTPVELVGGPDDGSLVDPDFRLDLSQLLPAFDEVRHLSWNALGLNEEGGPHVSLEGKSRGQDVFLQVFARAPDGEEAGLRLNVTGKRRRSDP